MAYDIIIIHLGMRCDACRSDRIEPFYTHRTVPVRSASAHRRLKEMHRDMDIYLDVREKVAVLYSYRFLSLGV